MKKNQDVSIMTDADYYAIRKSIKNEKYKLLIDLAWFTGVKWALILRLKTTDCYEIDGRPKREITFRQITRSGNEKLHQVPVHPALYEKLANYTPDNLIWMFPNREGSSPISDRWADKILRASVERAGLEEKGITTHSTRESFAMNLAKNGICARVIQSLMGYADTKMLPLINVTTKDLTGAIATL